MPKGYQRVNIQFDGRKYSASRLAWFYMTGEWPSHQIDHKDVNSLNNRWDNLRPATRSQNQANTRKYSSNLSGLKGVYRYGARWKASIHKDRKHFYLGIFDSSDEAAISYRAAAAILYGEFARAE